MDFHHHHGGSPSSSTTSSTSAHPSATQNGHSSSTDPMHSWWESISKARERIHLLSSLLPQHEDTNLSLSTLADTERPARSLLLSSSAYHSLSAALSSPSSGSSDDPLCHWLYDTYLSSDADLRLVVLSYIPLLSDIYLRRIHHHHSSNSSNPVSLSGFEAVLLALYSSETKARNGKPITVSIPDLSQPSLYHSPRNAKSLNPNSSSKPNSSSVGVFSPPLEPQVAVKSTKRAGIVGVALDCYYKQISQMPSWSKVDFCKFAAVWAGQDCPCTSDFDNDFVNGFGDNDNDNDNVNVNEVDDIEIVDINDERIPLPWELLQPVLRILGHCLMGPLIGVEVKDKASIAVRHLYARASHDLVPQAILATRSLIQLDRRARETAKSAVANGSNSNVNTPSKAKKPEILLVSK